MSTSETPPEASGQPAPPTPGAPWGGTPQAGPPQPSTLPPVPPGPPQPGGSEPSRRRIPLWVYWVVGIVVLALVAATIVFFLFRDKADGGAGSPAKAAEALESHVADKDVTGLASQVAPSEYAPYAENLAALLKDSGLQDAITGDKKKDPISALGSTDDVLDAVDLKRSEMKTKVAHEGKHLAAVDVTSWDVDVSVDREAMEKALEKVGKQQGSDSVESMLDDLRDASDDDLKHSGEVIKDDQRLRLVMVKEESGWYLSPVLTMVESSRLEDQKDDSDAAVEPDWKADPTAAKGASSPEKAFSEFVDNLLDSSSPKDLYADPVLSRLALPERRMMMLYRPYLDQQLGDSSDSSGMSDLGQIGSMLDIDWGLKSRKINDSLSVVSMGSTKLSIPMVGELGFDGAKISLPSGLGTPGVFDFGIGLENPDRLGFAAVKDGGGWRISMLDSIMNYTTLKANDQALKWGEQLYTSGDSDNPDWDELPPLAQNILGVTASFRKAVEQAAGTAGSGEDGGSGEGFLP